METFMGIGSCVGTVTGIGLVLTYLDETWPCYWYGCDNPRIYVYIDFEVDGILTEVRDSYNYVKWFSVILFGGTF